MSSSLDNACLDNAETDKTILDSKVSPLPVHHPKYYMQDEMATFLVENTLFRIPRSFLIKESEILRWMFMCPPGKEGPEGDTDSRAIPLPGVTRKEFEALFDFFYSGVYDVKRATLDSIDLLSIASRFDMDRIRTHAIAEIDLAIVEDVFLPLSNPFGITSIEKLALAKKFDIPSWLVPCYTNLCLRAKPLEEEEFEKIGWRTGVKLTHARERVRNKDPSPKIIKAGTKVGHELGEREGAEKIVREVFFPLQPTLEVGFDFYYSCWSDWDFEPVYK